jgi:hypothetical protein
MTIISQRIHTFPHHNMTCVLHRIPFVEGENIRRIIKCIHILHGHDKVCILHT